MAFLQDPRGAGLGDDSHLYVLRNLDSSTIALSTAENGFYVCSEISVAPAAMGRKPLLGFALKQRQPTFIVLKLLKELSWSFATYVSRNPATLWYLQKAQRSFQSGTDQDLSWKLINLCFLASCCSDLSVDFHSAFPFVDISKSHTSRHLRFP